MIYLQIVISILLIVLILIQGQSGGKGILWESMKSSYHTKHGAERAVFFLTIVVTIIFITAAIANLLTS
ncbi:MAG: preprotein translocase subunit SecG [Patescibacteria group bacterium]